MYNMDAVVVYIMGQSNAHGHAQDMCREDMVLTPMKHVFSLDRRENQFYGLDKITWSGYTSCGKNLGESQDHIYNLAYFLATAWEKLAEEKKMPDLYIVQISMGAQAVVNGLRFPGCGMWNPEHERVIKPGGWEDGDIGLYHLAMEILPLVHRDLTARYGKVKALGLHWIGNEDDAGVDAVYPEDFDQRYDRFFDDVLSAIGFECPLYFYKMLCTRREGFTPPTASNSSMPSMSGCAGASPTRPFTICAKAIFGTRKTPAGAYFLPICATTGQEPRNS